MKIEFLDGEGWEVQAIAKYEVCHRCEGRGHYFNGVYDVRCYECKGERVVLTLDYDRNPAWIIKLWEQHPQTQAEWQAEIDSERRMLGEL